MKKDIFDLKSDLSGLNSDFYKLEPDIQVTSNVNSKLSERLVKMKRCYANNSILGGNVEKFSVFLQALLMTLNQKFWKFEEFDVPIDLTLVEDCHRLSSRLAKDSHYQLMKLNRRNIVVSLYKVICRTCRRKTK